MKERLLHIYRRQFTVILICVIIASVCLAWSNRFVQDDAFISFRYADNFAHGKGLTWNADEHVEGYTNFLWTLFIGLGIKIGIDPVLFSQILGILFFAISLAATFLLTSLLFKSKDLGLLSVVILGTNYTFLSYATGGLETQMQAALVALMSYYCLRDGMTGEWKTQTLLLVSFLVTASLMTRLDSILPCMLIVSFALYSIMKQPIGVRQKFFKLSVLFIPLVSIIGGWFLWKLNYYGDILPNTFYAKTGSFTSLAAGLHYIYRFSVSYFLFVFPLIAVPALPALLKKERLPLIILCLMVGTWFVYIINIGGDFMEFRLFVPMLPLIIIVLLWLIFSFRSALLRLAMILVLVAGNLHHILMFEYYEDDRIETIGMLRGHLFNDNEQWIHIGKVIGDELNHDSTLIIATTAAGAIPFYSKLHAIDMLGMNDKWLARHGYLFSSLPGHQRISSCKYLLERHVQLVISHPAVLTLPERVSRIPLLPRSKEDDVSQAKIVEIPLDDYYKLIALYLLPHPTIDAAIERYHWKIHPISSQPPIVNLSRQ